MAGVLLQMAVLMFAGVMWRRFRPGGLDADATRRVLTSLVYQLLLPALVLSVLWLSPLGLDSLRIAGVAASSVVGCLVLAWLACRLCRMPGPVSGAVLLAAAFPNATYLGLPVLEAVLGSTGRSVAIQYDLFACTPLLLTVGMGLAQTLGDAQVKRRHPLAALLRVPALWAALLAVSLNLGQVAVPVALGDILSLLARGVVPLMLFSLGLSLRWDVLAAGHGRALVPVIAIQLLAMPLMGWGMAVGLGLEGEVLTAVVLEAAMPSMVLGIVICDRFGLDTGLYAAAATASTLLSLLTLPLWYGLVLGQGISSALF